VWTSQSSGTSVAQFSAVWGSGAADIYLVGSSGTVVHGSR
jgi:hypothetical protein